MTVTENNPFGPVEIWTDTTVKIEENNEKRIVSAKHYHIRYLVGESSDKRFVDSGNDDVETVNDKTIYMAPSIHRVPGETFHYDNKEIEQVSGKEQIENNSRRLRRAGQCDNHDIIEIAFQSPTLECCTMTREEAERLQLPVRYVAGYVLGRNNGVIKVALAKTVLETGATYYENIHFVPETVIQDWNCLE